MSSKHDEHVKRIIDLLADRESSFTMWPFGPPRQHLAGLIGRIAAVADAPDQKRHRQIEATAKKLKVLTADVPGYAYLLMPGLDEVIARARRAQETKAANVSVRQYELAAELAYDLLLFGGFGRPKLTMGGKYVSIVAELMRAATGKASEKSAERYCGRYVEKEDLKVARSKRPQPQLPPSLRDSKAKRAFNKMLIGDSEAAQERARKEWRRLLDSEAPPEVNVKTAGRRPPRS